MASQAVVVRYDNGEEYQVASVEKAFEVHPTARIVRWGDNRPYYPPVEAPATPDTETEAEQTVDLAGLTVPELRGLAESMDVAIPKRARKRDLIYLIETADL